MDKPVFPWLRELSEKDQDQFWSELGYALNAVSEGRSDNSYTTEAETMIAAWETFSTSDYQPGDLPVPVGTTVSYRGRQYIVEEHLSPENKPGGHLAVAYPDKTAYILWPVGVARKFGNGNLFVLWVRRTSFSIA